MYLYNLYENEKFVGTFKPSEIAKILNCNLSDVSKRADDGYVHGGKYKFEKIEKENFDYIEDLLEEWDDIRFSILNAPDKITKTMIKVPFSIWKKKPESKANKYRKNFINS